MLGHKVLDLARGGVFQTVAADEVRRNVVNFGIRCLAVGAIGRCDSHDEGVCVC